MRKSVFHIIFLFTILNLSAQYQVSGHVHDMEHTPLAGADVWLVNTSFVTVSDNAGYFILRNIPAGEYEIRIRIIGYRQLSRKISITGNVPHTDYHLETDPTLMDSVVVKGNAQAERNRQDAVSVLIARPNEIRGNVSLPKALEAIPGFRSSDIGAGSGKLLIRGLGNNRIVVLSNGIKMQDQQWGQDHGLEIDPFSTGKVELLKGPVSLTTGSDGIGGMISLLPLAPPAENTLEASLDLNGRSNNNLVGSSARIALRKKGNFFMLRYTEQHYGDYKVNADSFNYLSYKYPIRDHLLKNTAGMERSITSSAGIIRSWGHSRINVSNTFQQMGFFTGSHGIPTTQSLAPDGSRYNIDLPYQQVDHLMITSNTHLYSHSRPLDLDLGFQQNHRSEFAFPHSHSGTVPAGWGNTELDFRLSTVTSSLSKTVLKHDGFELSTGINTEHQVNHSGGYAFLIPSFTQSTAGVFTKAKYDVSEHTRFIAGIRYDACLQDVEGNKRMYHDYSWSAGMIRTMNEHITIKANAGKGFRVPGVYELFADGVHHSAFRHERGDSALRSEQSYQADLSFEYSDGGLQFVINPFVNYFSNYIFLRPTGTFSQLQDAGQVWQFSQARVFRWGGEAMLKGSFTDHLDASLGGDLVYATDLDNGYALPFIPPPVIISLLEYKLTDTKKHHNTSFSYQTRYIMAQNRTARNEQPTGTAWVHDISAGTSVHLGKTELELIVRLQNIFNTAYFNHVSYYRMINIPEPGRNLQILIRIPFVTGI